MSTAVNSAALNSAVNNYTYSYQGKFQAKLDKNDDAVWNRSELQSYADAYNKATGQKLDVDALMEKYANENGVIDYKAQQTMQADDALGLSVLQKAATTAASATDTTTPVAPDSGIDAITMSQTQKDAAISAVKQYTYDYSGKLQPLLDKNDDGLWSREELTNYANAYNRATGKKLDVDALMEKYGNGDGYIDPKNQKAMKDNDALGLTALQSAYNEAITTPRQEPTNKAVTYWDDIKKAGGSKSSGDYSLEDLLSTMSPERKMAYSVAINRLDSQSGMLSAMMGLTSGGSFNMFSIASAQNTARLYSIQNSDSGTLYNNMSANALNFTI